MKLTIETPKVFLPLLRKSKYKAAFGGRGSGKSHFFAERLIERCATEAISAVCLRSVQKSIEYSVKRLLESKIYKLGLSDYFTIQDQKIITPHGGVIIFQGLQNHTAHSIKSLEGFDVFWVEEASTLGAEPLRLLCPTARKPDSEIWFSWNPDDPQDPVDKMFRSDVGRPDAIVVEAHYYDNPFLPEELTAELEYDRARDKDKFNNVWLGGYRTVSGARIFDNFSIKEFEIPHDAIIRQGADWGFSNDPTVLVQGYIDGRKLYIRHEAYAINCEITETPELFLTVPDSEKWAIIADPSRPETISHMRKNGFPKIFPASKGGNSVREGIKFIKSYDVVIHPDCINTINEFHKYSYVVDKKTGAATPLIEDKHNHAIDAIRYAIEPVRRNPVISNNEKIDIHAARTVYA